MSAPRLPVRASANFRRNLERIDAFLEPAAATGAFQSLVSRLAEEIVPTLEQFPELGAEFLGRAPLSVEGRALFVKVVSLLGSPASLRQLVIGDYIVLYAVRRDAIHLLAIRHHRELSFDFMGHWP